MQLTIATLLCFMTLQASTITRLDTYEIIIPERFKDIFELSQRLTSKNAEIFPDLSTLDEKYHKEFYDLEKIQMPDDKVDLMKLENIFTPEGMCLSYFFSVGNTTIHNIFVYDLPCIYADFPDILSKTKQEQAEIVHAWYTTKKPHYRQIQWSMQCNDHIRFSNDHIDQWGRLIINGEEFFSGYHANAFSSTIYLPENLRELFELPGRLISNDPEKFPDSYMMQEENYAAQYCSFQRLLTPGNDFLVPFKTLKKIFRKKLDADGAQKNYRLLFHFFGQIDKHISNILEEIQKLCKTNQNLFDLPKPAQAKTVYTWFKSKKGLSDTKFIDIKLFDHFINHHVRFNDAPENQWGRFIINGEEVYRGTPRDE